MGGDESHHSSEFVGETEDQEVQSPLKQKSSTIPSEKERPLGTRASRQLVMQDEDTHRPQQRKRKSMVTGLAIVPIGLVNSRVSQLDVNANSSSDSMIETLKKQKRGYTPNARSAAAASSSPVGRHENIMLELSGSWVA